MSFPADSQQIFDLILSSAWLREILDFVRSHLAWTPLVVFLLASAESLVVVSFFVPATIILIGIGAIAGAAQLEFWPVWLAAAAGAAIGDWISYWIGFTLKQQARRIWPLVRYPGLYDRGVSFFFRWGVWSIFIGRFFGPLRAIVPLVAGVFKMPQFLFQMANIASAMVWAFVVLAPGFALLLSV